MINWLWIGGEYGIIVLHERNCIINMRLFFPCGFHIWKGDAYVILVRDSGLYERGIDTYEWSYTVLNFGFVYIGNTRKRKKITAPVW